MREGPLFICRSFELRWFSSGIIIDSGKILIWDAAQCKLVREMAGHDNRVGTMAWNSTLLASGSRDRNILLQDIRVRGHSSSGSGTRCVCVGVHSFCCFSILLVLISLMAL